MRVLEQGYPRKVHDMFMGLPTHVTLVKAVYEKMNGNIAIFAGNSSTASKNSLTTNSPVQSPGPAIFNLPLWMPNLIAAFFK